MMTVVVVVLLLLVLFFSGLAIDYWQRWKSERLWSENLQMVLAETRKQLIHEKRLRMIKEGSGHGSTDD